MKPNFALSLSFDGLRLMHRVTGGWHLVGQVALDDADLTGALARLKAAADGLDPNPMATKLLIPNDQIKYLALDTTRAEDADVRAALDGATPYAVDELVYDFAKGGGRTYIAAVAKETLDEAKAFASEHGFNPVGFAAVPEPFTYVGEAFFGGIDGAQVDRDEDAVVVIGEAEVSVAPVKNDAPDLQPEPEPEPKVEPAAPPANPADTSEQEVEAPDAKAGDTNAEDAAPAEEASVTPDPEVAEDMPSEQADESPEADEAAPDVDAPPPVFASRLRADRSEGQPASPARPVAPSSEGRVEPTFSRRPEPSLAVPTGKGTDPMPPVSAPSRDAQAPAAPAPTTDVPEPKAAPAVTGDAPSALPPEAAIAAASLTVAPEPAEETPSKEETSSGKGAAAAALGAAGAVGGAVGGMFASRRMARADARARAKEEAEKPADPAEEKSRLTVFGARKKPKPKPVVGGKPRFLGLILTAILLLFLLAIAAFAALSDDTIARWFGFGGEDTQIVETTAAPAEQTPAAPEVAAVDPADLAPVAAAPDALAAETAPAGGTVLTPEEAQRIYAATGVWQRAPRIPLTPRTTTLDALDLAVSPRPVVRVPASPLADASSVAGDAVIATPVDPPPPTATFDFGDDGLVVATPDGAATPDGILVIAGRPPLEPPVRPGTVAPEVTPQDRLAALAPETAAPVEDVPEGVIVIAGRPAIEPPARVGTTPPATAPEETALASGTAALVETDGLLVLAGAPPILPPIRPGTVAPGVVPAAVQPTDEVAAAPQDAASDVTADTIVEGLNLIAGPPPVLPPARPGTVAPQQDAGLSDLTSDVTAALATSTAQTPDANTPRPLARPEAVVQAAAALANTPVLGALTRNEAAAFRPQTRPAGLAPEPEPDPEPEPEPQTTAAPDTGLQISAEIAAAVQAAADRPNPIVDATALAVSVSERPDARPRNMSRIVSRAQEAQARAAAQVAAAAPRTVSPSGPTTNAVAQNATLENAINLREVNLIGIYGGSNDRRALVRLANGRYQRVTVGDRLDGGRVTAISAGALSYTQRGRAITLEVPG